MKRALMIVAALGLAVPAQAQEPDLGTDAQREAGKVLYDAKCAHCHGLTGDGIGPATDYLRPAPRDFTSSTFKFRSSMSGELPSDEDIKRSIREGMPYTGFLYAGLMISPDGHPKVIEYNCRFGDPETQPIMMRLQSDLAELCLAGAEGRLSGHDCRWDPRPAIGVVMAAEGYPGSYRKEFRNGFR